MYYFMVNLTIIEFYGGIERLWVIVYLYIRQDIYVNKEVKK